MDKFIFYVQVLSKDLVSKNHLKINYSFVSGKLCSDKVVIDH